ncbi:glycoside hydrolase family 120 protein [Piromyces sp. E2]|nr:glycoside hydrolase family 120 protein [Piromyces sp. E2]|eukprot:OUM68012.1 glycoside hydrolase family 120 protein [Piromyces sp. E2]
MAADIAVAGDEVIVQPGIYRESVNPKHPGEKDKPIVYRSAVPGGAHITGAEEVKGWTKLEGTVYTTRDSNKIFGDYNPYQTLVRGDWFIAFFIAHTGDLFLNGKSMYEVKSLDEVKKGEVYIPSWDQEFSIYKWYSEQDETENETVFYANFHDKDPVKEKIEISVRRHCFYPLAEGIGYITVNGFEISKAATQWAPPTAYQEGMVGPHWSKGWIIENCEIYESKSQVEGWSKNCIGSHIIRNCNIHDCGQTGIVGHLGGVFSLIENNHIHHINIKQNLAGAEIGGIKMNAAIDVIYRRNHIHHCTRGLWLDWQAQGTRVTQNLFHDNVLPKKYNHNKESMIGYAEDLFIEVSHGPTLVDNNIFLSPKAVKLATQGVTLLHNIIAGGFVSVGLGTNNGAPNLPSPRYTPYHMKHRTEIAGFMTILHGDCQFYNNIFIQQPMIPIFKKEMEELKRMNNPWEDGNLYVGTHPYETYPTFEEWDKMFEGYCGMGSVPTDRYYSKLPVWANGNVYFNGAKPMSKERDAYVDERNTITIGYEEEFPGNECRTGAIKLKTNLYDLVENNEIPEDAFLCKLMKTEDLPPAFEPEQPYENPDGSPIVFDTDFFGKNRSQKIIAGPFADASAIQNRFF